MTWTYIWALIWFGAWVISVRSQSATELIGTWSTKSNKTLTGPVSVYRGTDIYETEPNIAGNANKQVNRDFTTQAKRSSLNQI